MPPSVFAFAAADADTLPPLSLPLIFFVSFSLAAALSSSFSSIARCWFSLLLRYFDIEALPFLDVAADIFDADCCFRFRFSPFIILRWCRCRDGSDYVIAFDAAFSSFRLPLFSLIISMIFSPDWLLLIFAADAAAAIFVDALAPLICCYWWCCCCSMLMLRLLPLMLPASFLFMLTLSCHFLIFISSPLFRRHFDWFLRLMLPLFIAFFDLPRFRLFRWCFSRWCCFSFIAADADASSYWCRCCHYFALISLLPLFRYFAFIFAIFHYAIFFAVSIFFLLRHFDFRWFFSRYFLSFSMIDAADYFHYFAAAIADAAFRLYLISLMPLFSSISADAFCRDPLPAYARLLAAFNSHWSLAIGHFRFSPFGLVLLFHALFMLSFRFFAMLSVDMSFRFFAFADAPCFRRLIFSSFRRFHWCLFSSRAFSRWCYAFIIDAAAFFWFRRHAHIFACFDADAAFHVFAYFHVAAAPLPCFRLFDTPFCPISLLSFHLFRFLRHAASLPRCCWYASITPMMFSPSITDACCLCCWYMLDCRWYVTTCLCWFFSIDDYAPPFFDACRRHTLFSI